jgi:hypothetical protein
MYVSIAKIAMSVREKEKVVENKDCTKKDCEKN